MRPTAARLCLPVVVTIGFVMRSESLAHALTVAVADSSVPDGELLARFADAGDAAAFELLVRRHADLVWRVCRGELPADRHSAEDAFQATFLVLARKAGAVREPSAAGFLFRVARNAALRVRKRVGKVAEAVADGPANADPDAVEAGECSAAVVAEVEKLPDKFRLPVLLCFFEDCTHAEAADRLGWAVGTVASRLARAKDRLRDRLTRKGFALPAVLASATVSASTVRAAVTVATTPSAVPAGVTELTREVLNAMWNAKLKLIGGGVLAVLLAGGIGLGVLTAGPAPDEPKAKEQPKAKLPEKETPEQAELKKLQGLWRVTRLFGDAGEAPPEVIAPMRWEIVGNSIFGQDTPDEKRKEQLQFTLDLKSDPKGIDLTGVTGPKEVIGKKVKGIYELKGNTLRVCLGNERPTEFKVDKKGDGGLIELERIPETIKSLKDLAGEWRVASVVKDGKDVPNAARMTVEFHRDVMWQNDGDQEERFLVDLDGGKGLIERYRIITPSPLDSPGRVPYRVSESMRGRCTWKDDKLTLTFGEPGVERPAEANDGKGVTVMVLERGAKK